MHTQHKQHNNRHPSQINSRRPKGGPRAIRPLLAALLWLALVAGPSRVRAATIWTGPQITYTQPAPDPTQTANRDQLTPNVSLTRAAISGMFNGVTEASYSHNLSPADTEWAVGSLADYATLSYASWEITGGGNPVLNLPGQQLVLHLISDDIYLALKFTALGGRGGGGFSYLRSTPAAANAAPIVTLTNPIEGAVFVAPASISLQATASDADGTVTNVEFFDGTSSLGSYSAGPYSLAVNLAPGSHTLTAVASDNLGVTTASAAVTVTVISNSPPAAGITSPTNGSTFTAPAAIIIAAAASDLDGSVTNVEFLDGATSLGSCPGKPYSLLASLSVGTHPLTVKVSDNLGISTTSGIVTVTVASSASPHQPVLTGVRLTNTFAVAPALSVTNGSLRFTWQGDANDRFDLLYARGLGGDIPWQLAQPNIAGTASGLNALVDPPYLASPGYAPNTNLIYRVRALPPQAPGLAVGLQVVVTNLVSPTVLTHAHDGSGRLFIADQVGQIRVVDNTGNLRPAPFLDVSSRMAVLSAGYDERGLLGLAFPPGYATNGRFFIYYAAPPPSASFNNQTVLSEFKVSAADANLADPASERVLLTINQPEFNHEGADIVFGPDGYLYLGLGDGGGGGDQHGATGNAQVLTNLLGKVLRLDVDSGLPYGIPLDNPFVATPGARPEIYAYGFRNPWRFSFDRGGTHQGFVADVGQNAYEELDLLRKGANYGWRIIEGNHAYDPALAAALGVNIPSLDFPIFEYGHGPLGIAIIGGFVYRGAAYPGLVGKYVFGDFSTSFGAPDGQLYYLDQTRPGIWERFSFQLWPSAGRLGRFIKGFGEDEAGEIYLLSTTRLGPAGNTGDVRRLVQP
ncbi:MAG: PQQ-dependent sugar dehydrogenase [Verrucomicrobia bacterium]|nr:PQQ-dependent sugar dehydrogenase [Verrucomicrobiota bacterium]